MRKDGKIEMKQGIDNIPHAKQDCEDFKRALQKYDGFEIIEDDGPDKNCWILKDKPGMKLGSAMMTK